MSSLTDFDATFATATREGVNAFTMTLNPFLNTHRAKLLDFVEVNKLPAVFGPETVELGGLMSYGPNYREHFHRVAYYVDKIRRDQAR